MASAAFEALRQTLDTRFREHSLAAYTQARESVVPTGITALDAALAGGFPRGTIATLEGPASAGRSAVAARLLAQATATGLAGLVAFEGRAQWFPPSLAAAGVRLERLVVVKASEPLHVARAADILLRAQAFSVVVIPGFGSDVMKAALWTRLAALAHHAGALLVAIDDEASTELRYFASVRLELAIERVLFAGPSGPFCTLRGYDVRADVRKHKRAVPGGHAVVRCVAFDHAPPPDERMQRPLTPGSGNALFSTAAPTYEELARACRKRTIGLS